MPDTTPVHTPGRLALAYALSAGIFLALDACWLLTMSELLYRPALGPLMRPDVLVLPTVLFYVLYVAGIVAFAVAPAMRCARWQVAATRGAAFGLIAYATYDVTNQATLTGWSWTVTLADLCWGSFATATAAALALRALVRITRRRT